MRPLARGGMVARLAKGPEDLAQVMAFRRAAFPRQDRAAEEDAQDALSAHVMVEGAAGLLAYYRVMLFGWGAGLAQGYAARFYDVAPLAGYARPIAEMGRFCLAPGGVHPDVLRLAWGAMTRLVDEGQAGLIVGCSSFRGAEWERHRAGLSLLAARHIGPPEHLPGRKAEEVVDYPALAGPAADQRTALSALPPLLRTYLTMGGWVSDHAVVDRSLDTLHVFTCVEVDKVPPARAASLRLIAEG
ncbi:GNAT family N-acyltransferase [Xinfangfangia sp. CPCC 101601]|uniref:GNAT family N-acyltransferase n=1 Tax=Pseudogemmobacter lacusdianii TaxID=3069608 RepID=A0ABU0VUV2_9RHOB|nr:GNAT family N-acyltransferase [Xinfangfangia sp. CPCC 101601]MDQ2065502.1 GNAT family N-acyltransferase [Xinfangfangia sp. CPCC 101601]